MDTKALYDILRATTHEYRKGAAVTERERDGLRVTEVYAMPSLDEGSGDEEYVDVHFMVVGVNRAAAKRERQRFIAALDTYDQPERLTAGPSYIEAGAVVGDQGMALRMFALGVVLGLWRIIKPSDFGYEGEQADEMAGMGFVMMTGYRPAHVAT